jgi:hypothetical protein
MSKRTVRLTESELKAIITESVKRILNEKRFEDGTWRGVEGTRLLPDGYMEYNGMTIDVEDLENTAYEWLVDDYRDMMGYWNDSTNIFDEYDSDYLKEVLDAYCDDIKPMSESVKRVLKEEGFYADELYGLGASFENGQQGQRDSAPWWWGSFENFQKRVNSGKYDKFIFDDEWVEEFIDEEYPTSSKEREMMEQCISNRRYEIKNNRR